MTNVIISAALALDGSYNSAKNNPIVGYRNLANLGSYFTSTTAEAGFPVTNLGNPSTNLLWKGTGGAAAEYITIVGGEMDYMAIARHNLGSIAALVSVEYESAPSTWVNLVPAFTPVGDAPIIIRFVHGVYSTVRLKIQNATANPYIAVIYIGSILILERRIYVGHVPAPLARRSNVANAISESGNFLGRIVLSQMTGTMVEMNNLTPAWYRANMDPFIVAAKETPFFFAWRPYDYPNEVSYGWVTDNPQPSNQSPNGMMSVSFTFTAIQK